ncbi:Guanyl-specific ribonuclease N1/T1 [Pleurotus pulmonarius]|nr:hypothetical protein EYR38_009823 [Pleurotus pulmonarius]
MQFLASKLSALVAVLSFAVLAVVASPVQPDLTLRQFDHHQTRGESAEWNILDRRGKRATACDCKVMVDGKLTGNTYIAPVVQQTLDRAMSLTKNKQTLGGNAYPHAYNNHEALKFPGCSTGLMEYPLLKKGGASRSPEADRIVYDNKGKFCGCMTHLGVAGNSFQLCKS